VTAPVQLPPLPTDEEKVRARHHLGFLNVQEAYTFVLGTPAGVETQFAIEGALNRILPAAMPKFRELLAKCDATEEQRFDDQDALVAKKVGSIDLSGREGQVAQAMNYNYWRQSLANLLGIYENPYDKRADLALGGVNARVVG
jgi:hypothetical protein